MFKNNNYVKGSYFNNKPVCYIFDEHKFNDNFKSNKLLKVGNKIFVYLNFNINQFKNLNFDYAEFELQNENIETFKNKINLKIAYLEKFENKKIYYGYTSKFSKLVNLNGLKVNFQIVDFGTGIKVGYPMIYSSF